jgi:hypothetical protein
MLHPKNSCRGGIMISKEFEIDHYAFVYFSLKKIKKNKCNMKEKINKMKRSEKI